MLWQALISCRSSLGPEISSKFICQLDGWTLSSIEKQLPKGGELPRTMSFDGLAREEISHFLSS
jgi:hypothetical protein